MTTHEPSGGERDIVGFARAARLASRSLGAMLTEQKNAALRALADDLHIRAVDVLAANAEDMRIAADAGLSEPKLRRLALTEQSIVQVAEGVRQVAALPDPVGAVTRDTVVASGLRVQRVRAPLGVVAMIYEARPGVTVDALALCFKSGNACILKGGREAERSNGVLADIAAAVFARHGVPAGAAVSISGATRAETETLLGLSELIDLVIPRGGVDLIRFVHERSRIPTIQHFQGVCHAYIDRAADLEMAERVCVSAKTSAPATCNSLECVLVHQEVAAELIPRLVAAYEAAGVEVRGCPQVMAFSGEGANVVPAAADDFGREFLDLVIAMRVVSGLEEAIEHIQTYGSNHTETIITTDTGLDGAAERFVGSVQSSCVLVNASTRFNDGFQLGLGAEIGISTSRIHAYGPMGLEELTTQRWIVHGHGQTR